MILDFLFYLFIYIVFKLWNEEDKFINKIQKQKYFHDLYEKIGKSYIFKWMRSLLSSNFLIIILSRQLSQNLHSTFLNIVDFCENLWINSILSFGNNFYMLMLKETKNRMLCFFKEIRFIFQKKDLKRLNCVVQTRTVHSFIRSRFVTLSFHT